MKNSVLILGIILVGATSCKKTWRCNCIVTVTTEDGITSTTNPSVSLNDMRKNDAKASCQTTEDNIKNANKPFEAMGYTTTANCKIND